MLMSRGSRALTTLLLAAGVASGVTLSYAGPADANVQRSLADVRRATARYHDVNRALADGYVSTPTCVPGMGCTT
jgi:hypothetical protein